MLIVSFTEIIFTNILWMCIHWRIMFVFYLTGSSMAAVATHYLDNNTILALLTSGTEDLMWRCCISQQLKIIQSATQNILVLVCWSLIVYKHCIVHVVVFLSCANFAHFLVHSTITWCQFCATKSPHTEVSSCWTNIPRRFHFGKKSSLETFMPETISRRRPCTRASHNAHGPGVLVLKAMSTLLICIMVITLFRILFVDYRKRSVAI